MGSKSKPPPPPDYGPIAAASREAAQMSYALGKEQLAWAKEQYANDSDITGRVVDSFLKSQEINQETAQKDRARYEQIFQPLEDSLAADAASYSSPERRDLEMGRAQAGVAQQFDAQRANALRQLEGYGIDPTSTRYAALDLGYRAQQAATAAAAGNQAGQQVDAMGRALRSEAINVGRGYPGQIAGQYGTSLAAGAQGVNSTLAQTASGANTMGTNAQYMGLGNQSLGTWGNTLNMGYQNQLAAYNAEQNSSSGWGSALGLAGSLLTAPLKGTMLGMLESGGPVQTPGGAIPASASPTGGQTVDDVPAALTAGEFVIPKDVTSWLGEKTMHQLIEKARKEQEELPQKSGAIPSVGVMPQQQQPTFTSRPAALPVG
jgi:hypothetical protein